MNDARNAPGDPAATHKAEADDEVMRVIDDPADIDAAAWNALLERQPSATPFMRHEYLLAMHRSASAVASTGWLPQFLALYRRDRLSPPARST